MNRQTALLLALIATYSALWALTDHYGNATVRESVCGQLHRDWHSEVAGRADLARQPVPAYYCHSSAIAPFVVSLEFGYECGPICGRGADGFVFWIPGIDAPFYQRSWWAS